MVRPVYLRSYLSPRRVDHVREMECRGGDAHHTVLEAVHPSPVAGTALCVPNPQPADPALGRGGSGLYGWAWPVWVGVACMGWLFSICGPPHFAERNRALGKHETAVYVNPHCSV